MKQSERVNVAFMGNGNIKDLIQPENIWELQKFKEKITEIEMVRLLYINSYYQYIFT